MMEVSKSNHDVAMLTALWMFEDFPVVRNGVLTQARPTRMFDAVGRVLFSPYLGERAIGPGIPMDYLHPRQGKPTNVFHLDMFRSCLHSFL